MLEKTLLKPRKGLRLAINNAYREKELDAISKLIKFAELDADVVLKIEEEAIKLVTQVRYLRKKSTGIDSFLTQYALSSEEGIALMCLAEALLRVPDADTIDNLIKDKLAGANWQAHRGQSSSFFVNATTWALMLTGKVLSPEKAQSSLSKTLMKFVNRSGEGMVRSAVDKAMRIMSKQFVMGRTITEALNRARKKEAIGYRYSYDMLGEAALTEEDAKRYFDSYSDAIIGIGKTQTGNVYTNAGVSIKLSALHPRYQEAQHERVVDELAPKLLKLAELAKKYNIALTVDAEESERLEVSLDVIEKVFNANSLNDWEGFGIAVQSYQKRAFYLLDWIHALASSKKQRIMVRLIKGAYWDSEIKKAQVLGLNDYPVFTRKAFTDVSFQACARKLLTMTDCIYPQFATHNAYSVALILNLVGDYKDFEFQCLHGMGKDLYEEIVKKNKIACRIYAPVGSHEDLLPYLVRRLLENGANSSFVNRIVDDKAPISELVQNPLELATTFIEKINKNIPLPKDIFQPERANSLGIDYTDRNLMVLLQKQLLSIDMEKWHAEPILAGKKIPNQNEKSVVSPQNNELEIGTVIDGQIEDIAWALERAEKTYIDWHKTEAITRSNMIRKFALLLEENTPTLLKMACFEAGKSWNDAIAEIREAVDFCYYYATEAEKLANPRHLPGYTGETNTYTVHPRGIIVCISPWNFPLAIFVGQVIAALATGNCVIAKPAEQTPIIAHFAVTLMLKAGIPVGAIQLLPGKGEIIGAELVKDKRVKGVIFTGSTEVAALINKTLATRGGEIIPLIAETGGQNAMIVDSSALLEQVTVDVLTSAFGSAGQRCSALRVLYIQEEIYPRLLKMLQGAMAELSVGDPALLSTDIGPVIDEDALSILKKHIKEMKTNIICEAKLAKECKDGHFIAPTAISLDNIKNLKREVFGPILHIIKYKAKDLDKIIDDINSTEYGLTLGIHSRISSKVDYIKSKINAGNCYVNRNMIGAVVGLQPFGGEGLSGTGPKAGGPMYLQRLCHERVVTIDTTAAGGNASLMSLPD